MIHKDSSLAFGGLQQFREKQALGLAKAKERYQKLAKRGITLRAFPNDVMLGDSNDQITFTCTEGFDTAKTSVDGEFHINKIVAVGDFLDPQATKFTLWKTIKTNKLRTSNYRILTCKYYGYWEDK